jgi:hypothetical protein
MYESRANLARMLWRLPKKEIAVCLLSLGLPHVAVTATAVDSTAVFLLPEALTGREGRRDGRRGRFDG